MRRRTLLVGVLIGMLSSACGSTTGPISPGPIVTPPPPDPQTPVPVPVPVPVAPPMLGITRILSFGDSMTQGTTSPTFTPFTLTAGIAQSYPYKLQTLLTARYTAQTITESNAGRGGELAAGACPGGSVDCARDRLSGALSEARPELVILMEGANDINNLPEDSSNVSAIVGAMEDMVRNAQGRGAQVMLATIPPQRAGRPNTQHASLVPKYNNELKTMASKKGAILVDVNALLPLSLIGQDGLHPTEAGYQMIAEIFRDAIKSRYESSSSASARASR